MVENHMKGLPEVLGGLKSVDVLEMSGYIPIFVHFVVQAVVNAGQPPLHLQIVRFTNPTVMATHFSPSIRTLLNVRILLSHSASIHELEIHHCAHSDDLDVLPRLFNRVTHPIHLKIVFHPYLEFNKVPKIAQLLANARQKNVDDMKISITFKHSDIDRQGKLAIVYNLLTTFDVPFVPEEEDKWEFIRGKLCVHLKLEKMEDESLICHPHPPPGNR